MKVENQNTTSIVEISISCRDLLDKDVFSRSDPMTKSMVVYVCLTDKKLHCTKFEVCVYHQPVGSATEWIEFIRTETIYNNLNPDFTTKITMDYHFEEEQKLRFEVYDVDVDLRWRSTSKLNSPDTQLSNHDFLGFTECSLGQIVSAGFKGLQMNRSKYYPILPKKGKMSKGIIILTAEELTQLKEELTMKFEGMYMGSAMCCLFPAKIFFEFSKVTESDKYIVIYRSELCRANETLKWDSCTLTIRSICNGDKDRGLRIQCFQEGINGYHSSLGFLYTTVNNLKDMKENRPDGIALVGGNGKEKRARLVLIQYSISPIYTFVEYIKNTQIHCCFAIDFTASNGKPEESNSLHHFPCQTDYSRPPNPYEQAIEAVGNIILDYDSSKQFSVYGFGARVPPSTTQISHCFNITLNPDSPYCDGISGVLQAYRDCVHKIVLAGPTFFAPIIKQVASLAEKNTTGEHYWILVMITDGIINDIQATKEAVVNAALLPLSIIIVGVGGANFAAMDELDGDSVRLSYDGKFAERDIVQFVPYRDCHTWLSSVCPEVAGKWSSSVDQTNRIAKVKLAQEVLAEIPEQLISFMKSRGIVPIPEPSTSSGKK